MLYRWRAGLASSSEPPPVPPMHYGIKRLWPLVESGFLLGAGYTSGLIEIYMHGWSDLCSQAATRYVVAALYIKLLIPFTPGCYGAVTKISNLS